MRVSLIVAVSENGVIGSGGGLPWRLPADLGRFKRLTMGHPIIMGRKTFQSIGRLLPGRTSIVLTRQTHFDGQGALVANNWDQALQRAPQSDELFIIGGGEIYRLALPRVNRVYMTVVHADVSGDTLFPDLGERDWTLVEDQRHEADNRQEHDYSFRIYDRATAEEVLSK